MKRKKRFTAGFIIDSYYDKYQSQVLAGIKSSAHDNDISLICFIGGPLFKKGETQFPGYEDMVNEIERYHSSKNMLYRLISPERLDGCVILTSCVGNYVSKKTLRTFLHSFSSIPVVSIGVRLEGFSSITVDNRQGLYDGILHLIQDHGYRKIAFIQGPPGNPDADYRFSVYHELLQENRIPYDETLVVRGNFYFHGGRKAVSILLDERKARFDALIGANDVTALAAMNELKSRGYRVPEDIAVIGFDDIQESSYSNPPLSTVSQPVFELGYEALSMLLSFPGKAGIERERTLPTQFIIRNSCGCSLTGRKTKSCTRTEYKDESSSFIQNEYMTHILFTTLKNRFRETGDDVLKGWTHELINALIKELAEGDGSFTKTLKLILSHSPVKNMDMLSWHTIITSFFNHIVTQTNTEQAHTRLLTIFNATVALIAEIFYERHSKQTSERDFQQLVLQRLVQRIISSFSVEKLSDVIKEEFPSIGIDECYIVQCMEPSAYQGKAKLLIAYNMNDNAVQKKEMPCFPAMKILPDSVFRKEKRNIYSIMALYFKNEQLGFVVYGGENVEALIIETLSIQLSTALKGSDLVQKVHSYAHSLEEKVEKRTEELEVTNKKLTQEIEVRKKTEEALFQEKEQAEVTLKSIVDGVLTTDTEGNIMYLNPIAEKLTGWYAAEARGLPIDRVLHINYELTNKPLEYIIPQVIRENRIVSISRSCSLTSRHAATFTVKISAAPIRNRQETIVGVVIVIHNISEVHRMAEQLTYQSTHDTLTGLLNRLQFVAIIEERRRIYHNAEMNDILLYIDINNFKIINNNLGTVAGDECLKHVASHLSCCIRSSDYICRLGADHFGILLISCPLNHAEEIVTHVIDNINSHNFYWNNKSFKIEINIGLVRMNTFIEDLSALLSTAHLACSLSKKSGGNHLHIYRQHDDEFARYREELSLLPYISEALSENRFCLYSQAIQHISSRKHRISHFEILIRMIDKNREIIPPERFIPTAENFNVMPEIDRWVLTHLLPLLHEKLKAGKINRQTIFAINLSGSSLNHEAFLRFLLEYVKEFKFPKNFLCFEITETAALSHFARVVSFIDELHEKGIMLALDDFGSGWTSFNYLKSLPVDFLKIDGLFVKEIAHNKMDRALVETINHIGHIMGLTTIAEYVETAEIMKHIEQIGVDYAQGFYISKPRPLHL